jgi:hypothetical protein
LRAGAGRIETGNFAIDCTDSEVMPLYASLLTPDIDVAVLLGSRVDQAILLEALLETSG